MATEIIRNIEVHGQYISGSSCSTHFSSNTTPNHISYLVHIPKGSKRRIHSVLIQHRFQSLVWIQWCCRNWLLSHLRSLSATSIHSHWLNSIPYIEGGEDLPTHGLNSCLHHFCILFITLVGEEDILILEKLNLLFLRMKLLGLF